MARAGRKRLLAGTRVRGGTRLVPQARPAEAGRNPVMFIVEVGSVITTAIFVLDLARGHRQLWFVGVIAVWLWLTVLFANFAEAIAEGRGKAQANALRATRTTTTLAACATAREMPAPELQRGDVVVVDAGEIIPADGEIVEGVGSVDESAITGESAPVIREAGGDRSAVTGGTKLLSDRLVIEVTQEPGKSFLDRMIALVEGAERRKTPNEIALNILLAGLTITFLAAVVTLRPYAIYAGHAPLADRPGRAARRADPDHDRRAALGDRHRRHGPARAAQRARDVGPGRRGVRGRRRAPARQDRDDHARQPPGGGVHPGARRRRRELAEVAQLASLADETPEGRSIVVLAKERFGPARARARRARVRSLHRRRRG